MASGYLILQALAVPLLQWLPGEPLVRGGPAVGMLLGHLAWGLALGLAFERVHRPLQDGLERNAPRAQEAGWR